MFLYSGKTFTGYFSLYIFHILSLALFIHLLITYVLKNTTVLRYCVVILIIDVIHLLKL